MGTTAGFIIGTPPSTDPTGGTQWTIDNTARALKDTAPADKTRVTEIGWYCNVATEEAEYQVGIYSHDSSNNRPLQIIATISLQQKGTTAGWKKITGLSIPITAGETYWIAVQCDNTSTVTTMDAQAGSEKHDAKSSVSSLPDVWGASSGTDTSLIAIYALAEGEVVSTPVSIGQKELRTDWPFTEGLTAGTTVHGIDPTLEETG